MQVGHLNRLEKLPESHTEDTKVILQDTREDLTRTLILHRDPSEVIRLQGALELLDIIIDRLEK